MPARRIHRLAALFALTHATSALAYRPFDATDADIAEPGEQEFEVGAAYVDESLSETWAAPAFVANYGIVRNRELVLEGTLLRLADSEADARWALGDTALSLKQILRRGALQDAEGASIAAECGVLLPTIHDEHGAGGTCALIASQRWPAATLHLNGGLTRSRDHRWEQSASAILEGPERWSVRPVSELSVEWTDESSVRAGLLGIIWSAREQISFDAAVRYEETDVQHSWEVRAGFTLSR